MLSNLVFDVSTMLFLQNAKLRDLGKIWTILLTLSDVFFKKSDLKRPLNRQLCHSFHSQTNWKIEDVFVFIFKTCYFNSSSSDYIGWFWKKSYNRETKWFQQIESQFFFKPKWFHVLFFELLGGIFFSAWFQRRKIAVFWPKFTISRVSWVYFPSHITILQLNGISFQRCGWYCFFWARSYRG